MDDIIEKIRKLRAKAGNRASTEAEAQAAAMAAAKLMTKHDLSEAQVGDKIEYNVARVVLKAPAGKMPLIWDAIWSSIEDYTETKIYWDTNARGLGIMGVNHDVEMAVYLFEMVSGAAKRGWLKLIAAEMEAGETSPRMARRNGYNMGFGAGLASTIEAMAEERAAAKRESAKATGTDLVIVKSAQIRDFMKSTGLVLRSGKKKKQETKVDGGAYLRGVSDGQKVNVNRPLEQ